MDLVQELSSRPTMGRVEAMRAYIGNDTQRFALLIDCLINGDKNVSKYASWLVGPVVELRPHLLDPHYGLILDNLKRPNLPDTIKRCTMKALFLGGAVPEELQGTALQYAFDFLAKPKTAVSIQVFAMELIFDISKNEPDLLRELKEVIEDGTDTGSAAYKARGRRILKGINKLIGTSLK